MSDMSLRSTSPKRSPARWRTCHRRTPRWGRTTISRFPPRWSGARRFWPLILTTRWRAARPRWSTSRRRTTAAASRLCDICSAGLRDPPGPRGCSITWRTVAALELDYAFVELLPSCLSVIQGKCKQLGGLFLVRQGHAAQTSVNHLRDPLEWIGDSRWSGQQAAFRQALAEALIRQDGLGSAEAHEVVKRAYWACLAGLLAQKWQRRYGPQRGSARTVARWREIARRIPGLRSAWRSVRSRLPGGEFAIEALCRPSSRYYPDFMPVYRVFAGASAGEPPR